MPFEFITTVPVTLSRCWVAVPESEVQQFLCQQLRLYSPETLHKIDTDEELWMPEFCRWQQMAVFN